MIRIASKRNGRGHMIQYHSAKDAGILEALSTTVGLGLWLKADGITGISDGTSITTWMDSSGNSNDASQSNASYRPILKTGIINGYPVVRFNGANQFFNFPASAFSSYTAATMFVVIKANADPEPSDYVSGFGEFGSSSIATHFPYTDGIIYDDFATTSRKTTVNPTPSLAQFNVYCVTSAANAWTNYLNNVQLYTTSTNTVGGRPLPNWG